MCVLTMEELILVSQIEVRQKDTLLHQREPKPREGGVAMKTAVPRKEREQIVSIQLVTPQSDQ